MGTTSTPNLNLIKPNPFEEEDAWGPILNENWNKVDAIFDAGPALKITRGGTGATTVSAARTNLGLAIGSNVQAWDADLDAIAAIAGTSGLLRKTAANTWTLDTAAYAPLASPALTGTPTAPNAAVDTDTQQIATTAYVIGQGYLKSATASSTYLTSATAASTYLTSATAASTYLTSATAASTYLTSATAATTYQTALGFAPIEQGGGTSQFTNKIYMGWSASNQLRVQVDTTDFGVTWPINISGSAAAPSTANVLSATAAAAAGAVGTYALMTWVGLVATQNEGVTVSGSSLEFTSVGGGTGGNAGAGTWRLMGKVTTGNPASVFLRIL